MHELDLIAGKNRGGTGPILDRVLDRLLAEKSPNLQPLLRALTDLVRVDHRTVADWLTAHGDPIGDSAVYNYRKRRLAEAWAARNGVTIEPAK